jgi:hypothetical protein
LKLERDFEPMAPVARKEQGAVNAEPALSLAESS